MCRRSSSALCSIRELQVAGPPRDAPLENFRVCKADCACMALCSQLPVHSHQQSVVSLVREWASELSHPEDGFALMTGVPESCWCLRTETCSHQSSATIQHHPVTSSPLSVWAVVVKSRADHGEHDERGLGALRALQRRHEDRSRSRCSRTGTAVLRCFGLFPQPTPATSAGGGGGVFAGHGERDGPGVGAPRALPRRHGGRLPARAVPARARRGALRRRRRRQGGR